MWRPKTWLLLLGCVLGVGALCCVCYRLFHITRPPVDAAKVKLERRVAHLQERLGHAELLLRKGWRDVLQSEACHQDSTNSSLRLPSIFDYLPHLKTSAKLDPRLRVSNSARAGARLVLGIPSVTRSHQSYLINTLENLIANMNSTERDMTLIVVMLADKNANKVKAKLAELQTAIKEHLDSGLVEVINPPKHFYPDLDSLEPTLGDDMHRVKWRTKQAYDFAYLMMYASSRGEFYVQLEDDIVSKAGFVGKMLDFVNKQMALPTRNFFVLDFCELGFIGKLFKCVDLMKFSTYVLTFASDQPVDWILDNYMRTKVCRLDKLFKQCTKIEGRIRIPYRPSLFQHVGTYSSLKGKTQGLKDRQFGKVDLFVPHKDNVPADVSSSIVASGQFTLDRAYRGDSFFWGPVVRAQDKIKIRFAEPTMISTMLFRSGNAEHPNDRFDNVTVEVLRHKQTQPDPAQSPPAVPSDARSGAEASQPGDDWEEVAKFDASGVAQCGPIPFPVRTVRLRVLESQSHSGILSEIRVKGTAARNEDAHGDVEAK